MGIHILNKKTYNEALHEPWIDPTRIIYCGRPSRLGNPFALSGKASLAERDKCVEQFREYLYEQRRVQSAVWREVVALAAKIAKQPNEEWGLMCWCAPLACHCDVIKRAIEWVNRRHHTPEVHQDCEENRAGRSCPICDGGLLWCIVCGGGEGELPSECPGVPMTSEQKDSVMGGEMDFRDGQWVRNYNLKKERDKIFVFGSNLAGRHGKGAALCAVREHGAAYGQGIGRQGNSYAIPTKDALLRTLPLSEIEKHARVFLDYALGHPELTFQVTRVGCGLAGYKDSDIAPMFKDAPLNCELPSGWRS